MSKIDDRIAKIKTQRIGASKRKVLMVEGVDDVDTLSIFLGRLFQTWEKTWLVEAAGNKKQVLQFLAKEPTWLGLVDRDEWTTEGIDQYQLKHTNLLVLPRFCMENYLVDPAELWQALPLKQQQKITAGVSALEVAILDNLESWKRHAALWHVINPLWSGLRALGFKDELLQTQHIPDDTELEDTLKRWSAFVDTSRIMGEVDVEIARMNTQTTVDFLHHSLYAKAFYPQVVHPVLDRLLGQKSAGVRRVALFKTLPIPADLEPLWQQMDLG